MYQSVRLLLLSLFCLLCASCVQTKEVVKTITSDSIVYKAKIDSVYVHDSVSVLIKGDTIIQKEWHIKYKEKHDTTYIDKYKEVPVLYPEVEYINRLYWWQKTLIWIGVASLLIIILRIAWRIYKPF